MAHLPYLCGRFKQLTDHESEQIRSGFVTEKHPRTAVGISKDGRTVYLLVVDVRRENLSVGMDLTEVTRFLLQLGAYSACNLDGGGSSTMVVNDGIVNSPSDGEERRRCGGILLFRKEQ